LGDSGLTVSAVGVGCNAFGRRVDLDGVREILDAARPAVGSVIAGATRGEQVRANAAALRWQPTDADLADLDEITRR
jgi:aryl-alcohol dehydrogenase-like predicted oxidoreductase